MSVEFQGKRISAIVLDFNGTFYVPDKEFQKRVWKDARLRLVQKTFEAEGKTSVNGLVFGQRLQEFVDEALVNGWRVTFTSEKYRGTDEEFDEIINSVNLAEYLEFDQELADFIRELMNHVPVYLFSSSEMERVFSALESVIGDLAYELDERILSGDKMETARKPKEEAYQEMVEKLAVEPTTTIYADNNLREADMAAKLGFLTFLVDAELQGTVKEHLVINYLAQMKEHLTIIED